MSRGGAPCVPEAFLMRPAWRGPYTLWVYLYCELTRVDTCTEITYVHNWPGMAVYMYVLCRMRSKMRRAAIHVAAQIIASESESCTHAGAYGKQHKVFWLHCVTTPLATFAISSP